MTEIPSLSSLYPIVSEPHFAVAAAVAVLFGLVRGFSGFRSALVYVPVAQRRFRNRRLSSIGSAAVSRTTVMTIIGMRAGARLFRQASERTYRTVGYVICAISGFIAMPWFDGLFRQ